MVKVGPVEETMKLGHCGWEGLGIDEYMKGCQKEQESRGGRRAMSRLGKAMSDVCCGRLDGRVGDKG